MQKMIDTPTGKLSVHVEGSGPVILCVHGWPEHSWSWRHQVRHFSEKGYTVAAMDVLFPGIGEMVGGSQREERLDKLTQRMKEMDIPEHEMEWFLDTRRYGTCQHAGYGLGFERMMLFVTGMTNIRDVIPFPRFPGSAEF